MKRRNTLLYAVMLAFSLTCLGNLVQAQVVKQYNDPVYGKSERKENEHRHMIGGKWTPWHNVRAAHQWESPAPTPTPSPAPTPKVDNGLVWTELAFPTGDKRTSGLLVRKGFPRVANVGEEFCYQIVVTNLTGNELLDVHVADTIPAGFTLTSTDPQHSGNEGGKLHWTFSKLKALETKTIKVCGKATKVGEIETCAEASYRMQLCNKIKIVEPALVLKKTLTPEVLQCDPITMTITVTNTGSGYAKNVKITDNLPDGLVTTADKKTAYYATVGDLAPGQSKTVTVSLMATKTGKFDNTANAAGDGGLTADASASTVVKKPVLVVEQTCPKKSFLGRVVCSEVTVKNTGDGVAKDAALVVSVPAGATFVSASDGGSNVGGQVSYTLGNLAPGASKTVKVCYKPAKEGSYKTTSAAKAYCADAVAANCTTVVEGIPAILLEVVDINDPVEVGKTETYIITATNQGSQTGKNVTIKVTLEDAAEYVNSDGSDSKGTVAGKVINFAPVDIPVGATGKKSWKVVVKAVKAGDVRFTVEMTEASLTRPVKENEATNFYE